MNADAANNFWSNSIFSETTVESNEIAFDNPYTAPSEETVPYKSNYNDRRWGTKEELA